MSKLVYHFLLEKSIGMQIIYQTNLCLKYNTVQKAYIFIGFLLSDFKLSVHEKVTKCTQNRNSQSFHAEICVFCAKRRFSGHLGKTKAISLTIIDCYYIIVYCIIMDFLSSFRQF